ncbi:hypothetical protein DPMN_001837 [Dreissena polymorpha]|uniref:Uncharacterized protein n=1 Tax=Dreissena polymorpha TaxID=45954 RepID=A0A9D4MK43_DREPO|nr:hypothetical protein DPMN_001837 [Dreissena polymorpha]
MISEPGGNNKKLYSSVKSVAPLKKDDSTNSDASAKAEILSDEFFDFHKGRLPEPSRPRTGYPSGCTSTDDPYQRYTEITRSPQPIQSIRTRYHPDF